MNDIILEVEEELRKERLNFFVKKIVPLLFLIAIIVILSSAGYVIYKNIKINKQEQLGDELFQVLSSSSSEKNDSFQKLFTKEKSNIAAISGLEIADKYIKDKKIDKALEIYKNVYGNKSYDQLYRDLAETMYIEYINEPQKRVEYNSRLEVLSRENQPWSYMAAELLAVRYIENNQFNEAKKILENILSKNDAPQNIKLNAKIMLTIYGKKNDNLQ